MEIRQYVVNGYESNCFLVSCRESREALVVDPGQFLDVVARQIEEEKLILKSIFITHGHHDHVGGIDQFVERFAAEVFSGSGLGGAQGRTLEDGQSLSLGRLVGTALHVPGHTEDSFCLKLDGAVFTGDALFAGSIGGTASAEEKARLVDGLRQKILSLRGDTRLYPGHGAPTTVRIETTANPFFVPPRKP